MTTIVETQELTFSEQVLNFVVNAGKEVTVLDTAKAFNMNSGVNVALEILSQKNLIKRRVEKNGTRRYSA